MLVLCYPLREDKGEVHMSIRQLRISYQSYQIVADKNTSYSSICLCVCQYELHLSSLVVRDARIGMSVSTCPFPSSQRLKANLSFSSQIPFSQEQWKNEMHLAHIAQGSLITPIHFHPLFHPVSYFSLASSLKHLISNSA